MDRKKFFIRVAMLIGLIFVLNFVAEKFHLYYSTWYFDMFMHFLGGVWLGMLLIWFFKVDSFSLRQVFKVILGVLVIGVAWEIFEFVFINTVAEFPFDLADTISDMLFDLSGGFVSICYFFTRIMSIPESKVL